MSFYSYLFRRIDYSLLRQLLVRFSGDFSPSKLTSGAFFSLRCLIYKVHAAPGGTLLLYRTFRSLSRTFFKVFWHFLVELYQQQPFYFITFKARCQLPFLLFSEVFQLTPALPDSFVRIPNPSPFVNTFFAEIQKKSTACKSTRSISLKSNAIAQSVSIT